MGTPPPLYSLSTLLPLVLFLGFYKNGHTFYGGNKRHGQCLGILIGPGITRQIHGKSPMEKSHQEARVGAAPAGDGDIGISRLPSLSRGSCQHLGLHSGPDMGVGAQSTMTQLSWDTLHPRWLQQAYSKMHLPYHDPDGRCLPATRGSELYHSNLLRLHGLTSQLAGTLHRRVEFIWLTRKTTSR